MNTIRKIAKNTSFLLISYILSYIMGFFTLIYAARYLGAENFGILSLALGFTSIFGFAIDLGLNTLIVREVSRNKSLTNQYTTNALAIKIISSILTFGLVFLTIIIIGYSQKVIDVIYLILLYTVFISFTGIFNAIFQAYEKMEYQSISTILTSSLTLGGIFIVMYYKFDVISFAIIYALASFIILIYSILIYSWKIVSPKIEISLNFWKPTLKESWPFGITTLFVTIFYSIDSVILSIMVGTDAVGWYNAAYRLINALLVIPVALNIAVFPIMSQFYQTSKDSLRLVSEKYFKYMALLGIPIGVGTTLLADKIIPMIYGNQYIPSIIALQILVWSLVFIFMSGAFARLLEASNKQLVLTKITAICAVVNIILNIILIPKYSYIAASAVTALTEFLSLVLCLKILGKSRHLFKNEFSYIPKIIIASFIMGLFILQLKDINLLILIIISTAIYLVSIYLFKGFDDEDINLIKNIIK